MDIELFGYCIAIKKARRMYWLHHRDNWYNQRIVPERLAKHWIRTGKVVVESDVEDGYAFSDVSLVRVSP